MASTLPIVAVLLACAPLAGAPQQQGVGYGGGGGGAGYGGGAGGNAGGGNVGYGGSGNDGSVGGVPQGVGYNQQGGIMSGQAMEQAALAPEYHLHMVGTTAKDAVGSGGGPPITDGRTPGYVQAKYVTPTGNAVVMHHYGPGYPPPLGQGGPNDGNGGSFIANGTVAGNPDMVNWGLMPAWDREELGNGAWIGSPQSNSPMPYVGGFND
jgi:hypothetical protein